MQIDLLRHGACEGGAIFRGTTDSPLSAQGWQQMRSGLAQLSGPWQAVISSPLSRCRYFAGRVAAQYHTALHLEPALREIDFGDWEGRSIDSVWRGQKALFLAWSRAPDRVTPPAAEPYADFNARVCRAIETLAKRYGRDDKVLLVTHGGVIRLLLTIARNRPPSDMARLNIGYGFAASLRFDGTKLAQDRLQMIASDEAAYVYRD